MAAWYRFVALGMIAGLSAGPARAAWMEARSPHFVIYSDDSAKAVTGLSAKLERFDAAFRKLRRLGDDATARANPVTVYVVPSMAAVQRLCGGGERIRGSCTNVAGFYNGRAEGSVAFMPHRGSSTDRFALDPLSVLFHEYSHHMMLANFSSAYPAWFIEGFAEFNATASFGKPGVVAIGKAPYYRLFGLVSGNPLPLPEMMQATGNSLKGADRKDALYGRGWLLTHYLTFTDARRGQLDTYLRAVAAGHPSLDAARATFGDLKQLDREMDAYLKRGRLTYLPLPIPDIAGGAVRIRALTPGEAAMMPVRLVSERGVNTASARQLVAEARRLAAPYPGDPGTQTALAEAEFDAGYIDEAEAAADRALAVRADDRAALMYKGRARAARARQADSHDADRWREARSWFVKANRADPDDAAPLLLFYTSFLEERRTPTANAVIGLERAFALAPQDDGLRTLLARQYLTDRRLREARVVLAPLAFNPHAAADNVPAQLVALIDADDTKGIDALMARYAPDRADPAAAPASP